MLVSCRAGSGDAVFSLLHAGVSHFSLNRQLPILCPLVPVACLGQRLGFPCPSTSNGEGDAVFLDDEGDKIHLMSCSVSQRHTRGVTHMLHGGCPSKHSCVFPAGLGRWPSSHWGGKVFLQTLSQPGCSHWVWLKMPMTFRHAFLVPTRFLKDI